MSQNALANYTVYSRYAHYIPEKKRRENWSEIVDRVFGMHERKFEKFLNNPDFKEDFEFAKRFVKKKRVLGSQRALQFGGPWIEDHNLKLYNCLTSYVDRPRAFQEIMYGLLCGCGVGFSVQKHHISKLPNLISKNNGVKTFTPEDSIEGWADAIGVLINSYFENGCWESYEGKEVKFNFSKIRPEGSLIAGQFKAPGPDGLEKSLKKIDAILKSRCPSGRLRPIDAYDIIMHASDAVLSGGVRRSATIAVFSVDDEEMAKAKTGNWFDENPQRARSNNSAALLKGKTSKDEFVKLMKSTREFGEPGFVWLSDLSELVNPCVEINMVPHINGESGFQGCNLVEINGGYCSTEENFYECCRAAAIIGTMQAAYTDFKYLTEASKKIFEKEALLGCSITGIMDQPNTLLDPRVQRTGASIIVETNKKIANIIGINQAARTTCIKPAGSTSCILKTASGVHPHHAKRYIRRVQANKLEFPAKLFQKTNPLAVENSVWSANDTDLVISFLCEVPPGSVLKNQINAIEFLDKIKTLQSNWIECGTSPELCTIESTRHSVSCTVVVKDDEWEDVEDYIFRNQHFFSGISLLPASGDLDYPQSPFSTVLTPSEIVKEYGDASVFASGLVVDGLSAFDGDLWGACSSALGFGNKIIEFMEEPAFPSKNGYTLKQHNSRLIEYYQNKSEFDNWFAKKDWIRRVKQFSNRYFEGDLRKATYCLKHVSLWKTWCDLAREYKEIDWSKIVEENQQFINADTLGAVACNGGSCEIL